MKRIPCSKMSSENHISQDHCYLDDSVAEEITIEVQVKDSVQASTTKHNGNDAVIVIHKKNNDCSDEVNMFVPQIVYLPFYEHCSEHSDMFLLEDEKLVKPGDKFDSHNDLIQYLNDNAERWYFYYKYSSDLGKPNIEHEYSLYTCVYPRNNEKYITKGSRKRTNSMKSNCPCKIKLRHLPNEKQLTVVFVCNHHDHPLTEEEFYKLQHGRRLPPYIKEEIMDLLSLQVEMNKIKKYVQMQTGYNINRTFFYHIERTIRLKNLERQISDERLMELSQKISMVDKLAYEDDNTYKEYSRQKSLENLHLHTKVVNAMDTRHCRNIRYKKGLPVQKCSKGGLKNIESNRNKECNSSQNTTNEIINMQDLINVQESFKCETQSNSWITDQCVSVLPNRTSLNSSNRGMNKYKGITDIIIIDNLCESSNDYTLQRNYQELPISEENKNIEDDLGNNYVSYETVVTEIVNDGFENNHRQLVQNVNDEKPSINSNLENEVTQEHHESEKCDHEDSMEYASKEIIELLPDHKIECNKYIDTDNEMNEDVKNMKGDSNDGTIEYGVESGLDNSTSCDVEVQTSNEIISPTNPLVPVFDVYMKDGNVTGFVVNDDVIHNLKQAGVEKGVQTSETDDCITRVSNTSENNSITEPNTSESYIEKISHDTYQKHEYIHKYNIDQYMVQPHFPNYIKILSQEIHIDELKMIKNVYREKAMFKMTTTQRGKEGDTRIWYLTIRFE